MKRLAIASLPALFLACGSSEKGGPPPGLFGGFTPTDGTAVVFAPTTCSVPFVGTTSASGLAIAFTSFPSTCDFVTATNLCGSKGSATLLLALAVAGDAGGGTVGALAPGTYPFLATPPTGTFRAAIASAARTTATCGAQPGSPIAMNGGSITVATVTATRVTGSLDLRFADGTAYQRPFDLAVCPLTVDLCSQIGASKCTATIPPWTCVP